MRNEEKLDTSSFFFYQQNVDLFMVFFTSCLCRTFFRRYIKIKFRVICFKSNKDTLIYNQPNTRDYFPNISRNFTSSKRNGITSPSYSVRASVFFALRKSKKKKKVKTILEARYRHQSKQLCIYMVLNIATTIRIYKYFSCWQLHRTCASRSGGRRHDMIVGDIRKRARN